MPNPRERKTKNDRIFSLNLIQSWLGQLQGDEVHENIVSLVIRSLKGREGGSGGKGMCSEANHRQ